MNTLLAILIIACTASFRNGEENVLVGAVDGLHTRCACLPVSHACLHSDDCPPLPIVAELVSVSAHVVGGLPDVPARVLRNVVPLTADAYALIAAVMSSDWYKSGKAVGDAAYLALLDK